MLPSLWWLVCGVFSDRHRLLRYGQMLLDERRVWCGNHWWRSLELQFEVMDRRDGMQVGGMWLCDVQGGFNTWLAGSLVCGLGGGWVG